MPRLFKSFPITVYTSYGDKDAAKDAKRRWEEVKKHLKKGSAISISSDAKQDEHVGNAIRNNSYHYLAIIMRIEPHLFSEERAHGKVELGAKIDSNKVLVHPQIMDSLLAPVRYKIKAAVTHTSVDIGPYKIHSFPMRVGHHFWMLVRTYGDLEEIVETIHGLATQFKVNAYGNVEPAIPSHVGTYKSILKAYVVLPPSNEKSDARDYFLTPSNKNYWIEPDESITKYGDHYNESDAITRWNQAKLVLSRVNDAQVSYSFCGFGKSLGFFKCRNSNSVYAAFSSMLKEETPPQFEGYFSPGSKTKILFNQNAHTIKSIVDTKPVHKYQISKPQINVVR